MEGQKLELAAKILPRVVFKRPWRPLGGALGGPREAKIEAGRMLLLKLKRQEYTKLFLNAFLIVLGAPWGSKNEHFVLERLQKSAFQEVAFQDRLETGFGVILEAKLGPSWRQVGSYKGSKWHAKVTSMLS